MVKKRRPSISARFGTRYGSTIKKRWTEVMLKRTKKYTCPSCLNKKVERISVGVWKCKKCAYTFTGGAYEPQMMKR